MRTAAKQAKHVGRQKVLKAIGQIKKKITKQEAADPKADVGKLKHKLETKLKLLENMKSYDQDRISRQALIHDEAHFTALVTKVKPGLRTGISGATASIC